jgi:hypothetical protein
MRKVCFKLYCKSTNVAAQCGIFCDERFNIFSVISVFFVRMNRIQKVYRTAGKFIYYTISLPMQPQRTKCESNFSVLWLSLTTVACYLKCLSVRSLHTFWTLAEFTEFLLSLSLRQKHHIARRLLLAFITNARNLMVSKQISLFSWHNESVCLISAISPSYYVWSYQTELIVLCVHKVR